MNPSENTEFHFKLRLRDRLALLFLGGVKVTVRTSGSVGTGTIIGFTKTSVTWQPVNGSKIVRRNDQFRNIATVQNPNPT